MTVSCKIISLVCTVFEMVTSNILLVVDTSIFYKTLNNFIFFRRTIFEYNKNK